MRLYFIGRTIGRFVRLPLAVRGLLDRCGLAVAPGARRLGPARRGTPLHATIAHPRESARCGIACRYASRKGVHVARWDVVSARVRALIADFDRYLAVYNAQPAFRSDQLDAHRRTIELRYRAGSAAAAAADPAFAASPCTALFWLGGSGCADPFLCRYRSSQPRSPR